MGFAQSAYQEQFRKGLAGETADQYDQLIGLAKSADTVDALKEQIPADFHPFLDGVTDVNVAVSKIMENMDWGKQTYAPPKSAIAPKAKASAAAPAKKVAPPPGKPAVEGEAVPSKRRGNPEALKRAREARGLKSPELIAADRQTVVTATVDFLKANPTVQHVKPLVFALIEALKGKGSDGKDLTESFIYTTITEAAKDNACPFVGEDMEGRKRGYKLRA